MVSLSRAATALVFLDRPFYTGKKKQSDNLLIKKTGLYVPPETAGQIEKGDIG